MPRYVDGFVIPIKRTKIAEYRRIATLASKIWKSHGALEYYECIGDDLDGPGTVPFPAMAKAGRGETVIFAWIVYTSRAHRDRVNAKVMKDPRMLAFMQGKVMPIDCARMAYGGFSVIVRR